MKPIGPHTFMSGWPLCLNCVATLSGALLDEQGSLTTEGGSYCGPCRGSWFARQTFPGHE